MYIICMYVLCIPIGMDNYIVYIIFSLGGQSPRSQSEKVSQLYKTEPPPPLTHLSTSVR